ncbi:hypothetical protein DID88_008323 [Monilinia fructigena]|uniref:Uncharacterized protein n=1 Tax=Monilinia fructigena TaxID=38457 RepID=A0A395J606_9HELO|nr:hypothetical protein DID88_008323 [Monilinia fructigena]
MPSQAQIQKAREQQKARDILVARREAAAKRAAERKKALKNTGSMATEPAMTSDKLDSQASDSKPISAIPRIKKKPGTSMAEKRAVENAIAAAKQKRAEQEKEEGEIDSDDEEVVFKGRQKKITETVDKMDKTSTSSGCAYPRDKPQMAPRNSYGTKFAKKTDPERLKDRGKSQTSEQQKKPEIKNPDPKKQTSKRKIQESDAENSEIEISKPLKKQKTAKGGMNFENPPTKRKHVEEEEEALGPLKRQKTTEQAKKPVALPVKRAPAIKETHFRRDPNVNLLYFGPPPKKPIQNKAATASAMSKAIPEKVSAKETAIIEKKEVSKKATKTVKSSAASKVAPKKSSTLPVSSASTRSSSKATQSPPSAFNSIYDRVKSRSRGIANSPIIEAESSSSSIENPVEAAKKSRSSRSSNLSVESEPVSDMSPINRLSPLLSPTLPPIVERDLTKLLKRIAEEKEEENMAREMEEELEQDRVDDLELPEPAIEASYSIAVELDSASDMLLETDANDYMANLEPDVAAVVQVPQQEINQLLKEEHQAANSDVESVEDVNKSSAHKDAVETTKSPISPAQEVPDSTESKVPDDEEQSKEAEAPMKNQSSSLATSPALLIGHIAAPEQHAVISVDEYLPRGDSNQNEHVTSQQNVTRKPESVFKYASEIGYESDMSEEDPDPEPTPVCPTPFKEAGNFDELELDVDEALKAQQAEANLEATDQEEKELQSLVADPSSSSTDSIDPEEKNLYVASVDDSHSGKATDKFDNQDPLQGLDESHEDDLKKQPQLELQAGLELESQPSSNDSAEQSLSVEENNLTSDTKTDNQVKFEVHSPETAATEVERLPELPLPNNGSDHVDLRSPEQSDNTNENIETLPGHPWEDNMTQEDLEFSSDDCNDSIDSIDSNESDESDNDGDKNMWDDDDTEALLQNHMVPAELADVVTEADSINYEQLITEVKAAREETIRWERENGPLPVFIFSISRTRLLCQLGCSEERVAHYMEVHQRYEDTSFPKLVAQRAKRDFDGEESSDDESEDDEDHFRRQGFSVLIPGDYDWNHDDMVTDPNGHPFGPIN